MSPRKVPGTKYTPPAMPPGPPGSQSPIPGQYGGVRLYAGTASGDLGQGIAEYIGTKLGGCVVERFSNENIFIRLNNSVRGQDVYLVQCMTPPLSDNIMEMLIMMDTLKRDSAGRITLVIPYLPYGRSDKKDQ